MMKFRYFALLGLVFLTSGCMASVYNAVEKKGIINEEVFLDALEKGANPNECWGAISPLAYFEDISQLKLLLEYGADMDNPYCPEILGYAAEHSSSPKHIQFLIDNGAEEGDIRRAIFRAAENSNPKIIEVLIKNGANVNAKMNYNVTPLMIASFYNNLDVVKALLKAGAKVNSKNSEGQDAFIWAVNEKNYAVAKTLLQHGAKPRLSDILMHEDPNVYDNVEYVRLAIKNGAKVNAEMPTDGDFQESMTTPLTYVSCYKSRSLGVVRALLENGANAYAENIYGYSAYNCGDDEHIAVVRQYVEAKEKAKSKKINDDLKSLQSDKLF